MTTTSTKRASTEPTHRLRELIRQAKARTSEYKRPFDMTLVPDAILKRLIAAAGVLQGLGADAKDW